MRPMVPLSSVIRLTVATIDEATPLAVAADDELAK